MFYYGEDGGGGGELFCLVYALTEGGFMLEWCRVTTCTTKEHMNVGTLREGNGRKLIVGYH